MRLLSGLVNWKWVDCNMAVSAMDSDINVSAMDDSMAVSAMDTHQESSIL